MFKKSIMTIAFIATTLILSGCSSDKNGEKLSPQKIDYIVTTQLPTETAEGIVDKANPAYVKIYPHFNRGEYSGEINDIVWFKKGLGSKIPPFKRGKLLEVINTDKAFAAYIGNVDEKMFSDYFSSLADVGYQFFPDKHWSNMTLYNEKYEINLRFGQDGANVTTVRARILSPEESAKAQKTIAEELAKKDPNNPANKK